MIEYTLIRSDRKTVGMQIKDGKVIVRAPKRLSRAAIDGFVSEHEGWAREHLAKSVAAQSVPKLSDAELHALADRALQVIPARVAHYAALLGVDYGRITIRAQKTKWGSCSSAGNLNFNCLLMLAPPGVLDSVVVHELCHRKHMDHSSAFYAEIARVMPEYQQQHAWLKQHGDALMARAHEK